MLKKTITEALEPLATLFFPPHCAHCKTRVETGMDFCSDCEALIERIKAPRCESCSQPYDCLTGEFICPNCRGEAFYFECAVAVVRSRSVIRDLIHRIKYGKEIWLARVLAQIAAEGLEDSRLVDEEFDALVPVPLHPKRLREREYNQAAVIAENLSRRTAIPVLAALERRRYTTTQTALDRKNRRQNLRNAFSVVKNADVTNKNLLLVDDVLTTGSTLDACAAVLLERGASSVRALTVARG
jgi:ComF family protein